MDSLNAQRFSDLREKNGFSRERLAEVLGLSVDTVARWENAEESPDIDFLKRLAALYGLSVDELLNTSAFQNEPPHARNTSDSRNACEGAPAPAAPAPTAPAEEKAPKSRWMTMPFPLLILTVYLALGFSSHLWHPAWLLFLTVPLYYTLIEAITRKNATFFAFPVLITALYLCAGIFWHHWNWPAFLFILVPIYYCIFPGTKTGK